jgi:manganese efflux pump family protein
MPLGSFAGRGKTSGTCAAGLFSWAAMPWLLLGVGISLDELAIGFTLGLLWLSAALVIVRIALQAFIVTQLGLRLGNRLSERLREAAELLAGAALTGLGLALLAEQLLG